MRTALLNVKWQMSNVECRMSNAKMPKGLLFHLWHSAFGIRHFPFGLLAPGNLRRPVEIDPEGDPPGALRAEADPEPLPVARLRRRPANLGHRRQARHREK